MEAQKKLFKYNITKESERKYWMNNVLNKLINYNTTCPNCKLPTLKSF